MLITSREGEHSRSHKSTGLGADQPPTPMLINQTMKYNKHEISLKDGRNASSVGSSEPADRRRESVVHNTNSDGRRSELYSDNSTTNPFWVYEDDQTVSRYPNSFQLQSKHTKIKMTKDATYRQEKQFVKDLETTPLIRNLQIEASRDGMTGRIGTQMLLEATEKHMNRQQKKFGFKASPAAVQEKAQVAKQKSLRRGQKLNLRVSTINTQLDALEGQRKVLMTMSLDSTLSKNSRAAALAEIDSLNRKIRVTTEHLSRLTISPEQRAFQIHQHALFVQEYARQVTIESRKVAEPIVTFEGDHYTVVPRRVRNRRDPGKPLWYWAQSQHRQDQIDRDADLPRDCYPDVIAKAIPIAQPLTRAGLKALIHEGEESGIQIQSKTCVNRSVSSIASRWEFSYRNIAPFRDAINQTRRQFIRASHNLEKRYWKSFTWIDDYQIRNQVDWKILTWFEGKRPIEDRMITNLEWNNLRDTDAYHNWMLSGDMPSDTCNFVAKDFWIYHQPRSSGIQLQSSFHSEITPSDAASMIHHRRLRVQDLLPDSASTLEAQRKSAAPMSRRKARVEVHHHFSDDEIPRADPICGWIGSGPMRLDKNLGCMAACNPSGMLTAGPVAQVGVAVSRSINEVKTAATDVMREGQTIVNETIASVRSALSDAAPGLLDLGIRVVEQLTIIIYTDETVTRVIAAVSALHQILSHFGGAKLFLELFKSIGGSLAQLGREVSEWFFTHIAPVFGYRTQVHETGIQLQALKTSDLIKKNIIDFIFREGMTLLKEFLQKMWVSRSWVSQANALKSLDINLYRVMAGVRMIQASGGQSWVYSDPMNSALTWHVGRMSEQLSIKYAVIPPPPPLTRLAMLALFKSARELSAGVPNPHRQDRAAATIVYFHGPAGQGKSFAANMLRSAINRRAGVMNEHECFAKPRNSDYYDGYASQQVFLMSDCFSSTEIAARREEAQFLLDAHDTTRFPLNMSAVADKGNVFFNSPVVLCTSNVNLLALSADAIGMSDKPAVDRRIDFNVRVECVQPSDQPLKTYKHKTNGNETLMLDPRLIAPGEVLPPCYFQITVQENAREAVTTTMSDLIQRVFMKQSENIQSFIANGSTYTEEMLNAILEDYESANDMPISLRVWRAPEIAHQMPPNPQPRVPYGYPVRLQSQMQDSEPPQTWVPLKSGVIADLSVPDTPKFPPEINSTQQPFNCGRLTGAGTEVTWVPGPINAPSGFPYCPNPRLNTAPPQPGVAVFSPDRSVSGYGDAWVHDYTDPGDALSTRFWKDQAWYVVAANFVDKHPEVLLFVNVLSWVGITLLGASIVNKASGRTFHPFDFHRDEPVQTESKDNEKVAKSRRTIVRVRKDETTAARKIVTEGQWPDPQSVHIPLEDRVPGGLYPSFNEDTQVYELRPHTVSDSESDDGLFSKVTTALASIPEALSIVQTLKPKLQPEAKTTESKLIKLYRQDPVVIRDCVRVFLGQVSTIPDLHSKLKAQLPDEILTGLQPEARGPRKTLVELYEDNPRVIRACLNIFVEALVDFPEVVAQLHLLLPEDSVGIQQETTVRLQAEAAAIESFMSGPDFPLDRTIKEKIQIQSLPTSPTILAATSTPFVMQGCDNPNALELIGSRVIQQVYRLILTSKVKPDGTFTTSQGQAWNVTGRFITAPLHSWKAMQPLQTLELRGVRDYIIDVSFIRVHKIIPLSEVVILELDRRSGFLEGRNLVDRIISEAETVRVGSSVIVASRLLNPLSTSAFFGCTGVEPMDREALAGIAREGVVLRSGYHYRNLQTFQGMCSAPVVLLDASVAGKIIGLHCAGNTHSHGGFAAPIIREDFLDLVHSPLPEFDSVPADLVATTKGIVVQGFVPPGESQCQMRKSTIRKSRIFGKFSKTTRAPAALEPVEGCDPLIKGQKKAIGVTQTITKDRLDMIGDYIYRRLRVLLVKQGLNDRLGPIDTHTAIFGSPGHLSGLDMSTSAGFPFNTWKNGSKKSNWIDLEGNIHPFLKSRIQMYQNLDSLPFPVVFRDTLKDEKRELSKVQNLKTRVFSAAPLDFTIAFRQDFLTLSESLKKLCVESPIAIGIDAHGPDWKQLHNQLSAVSNTNLLCGDFGAFDGSLASCFISMAITVMSRLQGICERGWDRIIANAYHISDRLIYQLSHSIPSGTPATSLIDTICNWAYHLHVWLEVGYTLDQWTRFVDAHFYGDDSLIAVADGFERFNMKTVASVMGKLGVKYTSARKDGSMPEYETWDSVSFLQRSFVERDSIVFAPLRRDIIHDSVNWVRKDSEIAEDMVLAETVRAAILEMSHYPRTEFIATTSRLADVCAENGVMVEVAPFDSFLSRYLI